MALQSQTVAVPLFGGIDTKTDPKLVPHTSLLRAQNVRFSGVQSVDQRYGQTKLSQTVGVGPTVISAGKALGTFNNELLAFDGSSLYSYAQTQSAWFNKGTLTEVVTTAKPVINSSGSAQGIASALASNLEVYAWEDTRGGVYYAVRDPTSGTFAVANKLLSANGSRPQILTIGTDVVIFYAVPGEIHAALLSTTNPSAGIYNNYIVATDYNAGAFTVGQTTTELVVCYLSTGPNLTFIAYDLTFGLVGRYDIGTPGGTMTSMAASWSSNNGGVMAFAIMASNAGLYTAYWYAFNLSTIVVDAHDVVASTASGMYAVALSTDPVFGVFTYYYDVGATTTDAASVNQVQLSPSYSGTWSFTLGSINTTLGLRLAATPCMVGSKAYLVCASPTTNMAGATSQQTSYYLCTCTADPTTPTVAPTFAILQRCVGDLAAVAGNVLPALQVSGTNLFAGLAQKTALRVDYTGTVYSQNSVSSCYFNFPSVSQLRIVPFHSAALINCGSTFSYDGAQVVESGFWEFPDGITATVGSSGSGLSAGQYYYQVTYEWPDAAGQIHLSAPSYIVGGATGVTVTAGQYVTLTIPYLQLTKRSDVQVCIYRGVKNTAAPLYKIATLSNSLVNPRSFIYVDGAADSAITGNQFLYAPVDGSGELENDPPPPFSMMIATKTRVFGIAQDDPTALWYSKPLAPGRPAEWSVAQIKRIESAGGAPVGLAALDTQCVVFKQQRMYYLPGNGPNAAGTGEQFPELQQISSTTGCTNAASIVSTHDGVWFQSDLGLCVLNRNLTLDLNIGTPASALTSSLTISAGAIVPAQNQIRWLTTSTTALVFDFQVKRWSTYLNYDGVGYAAWNSTYARLRSNGEVWYEDVTTYLDGNAGVSMLVETAHLKPAGLAQGYAMAWYANIMGTFYANHTLNIDIEYDYLGAPTQSSSRIMNTTGMGGTFGSDATYGAGAVYGSGKALTSNPYLTRIALQRQSCAAIKFTIYTSNVTGRSCSLNELALQLGVVGGLVRLPAAQQV